MLIQRPLISLQHSYVFIVYTPCTKWTKRTILEHLLRRVDVALYLNRGGEMVGGYNRLLQRLVDRTRNS